MTTDTKKRVFDDLTCEDALVAPVSPVQPVPALTRLESRLQEETAAWRDAAIELARRLPPHDTGAIDALEALLQRMRDTTVPRDARDPPTVTADVPLLAPIAAEDLAAAAAVPTTSTDAVQSVTNAPPTLSVAAAPSPIDLTDSSPEPVAVSPPVPAATPRSSAATTSIASFFTPAAAAAAAATPSPSPASSPASSPAAASPSPSAASPSDVLFTLSDVSLLVPKGKFTLRVTPTVLHLCNPGAPAKDLSLQWRDVDLLIDVPDMNKRDWLVVIQLKKDRGLLVGKKMHAAIICKFIATEKVKAGRFSGDTISTGADATVVSAASQMAALRESGDFIGSKVASSLVGLLRLVPALAAIPIVGHEPAIFDSLKKLPCVNCKHGVEDGSLYFLRTGLLFVKPTRYIAIRDIDGITPARGMSSTFDMKVGIVGQKEEVAYIMIEPKEEGSITKYCQFLGREQTRIEREDKARKNGQIIPTTTTVTPPPAAASASATTHAAAAAGGASDSTSPIQLDADAIAAHGDMGISMSNVIAGPRPLRATRPRSFEGMDDDDEEADAAPPSKAAAAGSDSSDAESDGDADSDARSSSDDEWSDAASESSEDSAEYDSEKDAEAIASDDDQQRERRKRERKEESSDEDEAMDD